MMEPKLITQTGVVQDINGENILINTQSDEPIEMLIKNPILREHLLLKRVKVTLEVLKDDTDSLYNDIKETKTNMAKAKDVISLESLHRSLVSKKFIMLTDPGEVYAYLARTFKRSEILRNVFGSYTINCSVGEAFVNTLNYAIDMNFKTKG